MNNTRQAADIELTVFGGLCTEIAPSDLPEGASPLNWDCDYDIGSVYTRGGLTPVYSFENFGVGPNYPRNSGVIIVNNVNWTQNQDSSLETSWLNGQSPIVWWNTFGFYIANAITGIEVAITGSYSGESCPQCWLQLIQATDGTAIGQPKLLYFTPTENTFTVGGANDTWGTLLDAVAVSQPNFGVEFYAITVGEAGEATTVQIRTVAIKIYRSQGADNIDWIKTFIENNQDTHTFVLDSSGTLWEENVTNNPGILSSQIATIYPNQFAVSATNQNEEWIAFSDLLHGTNIPRHGTNFDRISQVGPGDPPAANGVQTGGMTAGIETTWPIASITQDNTVQKSGLYDILWSAGPGVQAPGNVLTIFYEANTSAGGNGPSPVLTTDFQLGGAVNLSNLPAQFAGLNGTYKITGVGFSIPPGATHNYWYFTVQTPQTGPDPPNNNIGYGGPNGPGNFQPTMATVTLSQPANLAVGNQIMIQGAGCFNGTWTILNAVNGGALTITATSFSNGVATYTFIVNGATPQPVAGQLVTVIGALNGPINPTTQTSIFNVVAQPITSVSGGQFTVNIPGVAPDTCTGQTTVSSQAESQASAIVLGTVFQFDPGLNFLRTLSPPTGTGLCANWSGSGATLTVAGGLGGGVRKAVVIFETRNGYLTAPSPPMTFETTVSDNAIQVCNVDIGPANVIKRIVAFTPANSGQFFYIPNPVKVTSLGVEQIYDATVINDNTTTGPVTFTFTDAVLMSATAIDIQGNNLFEQIEVGASCAIVPYAGRNFYIKQNNKVQNFINTTFDGGYIKPGVPAGWTVDSAGGTLQLSPVFGFSYYISNGTGAIHQTAFQDAYMVPILRTNVAYSIRIDIRVPSGMTSQGGYLVIDAVSAQTGGTVYGSAAFPLSAMSAKFQTLVLPFLPRNALPLNVPSDLELRLYANLPGGADVEIDRFEVFPTRDPDLITDVYASYIDNLEAVDGVTGDLGISVQNNQPVLGAFVQYDLLYFLKTGSMFSTQDSAAEEPAAWKIRQVSNKVGTCGIHAYDCSSPSSGGEEWCLTACRNGVYIFSGTEPIKISQEIQPCWDAINWAYAHTIILRNDITQRRFTIHVPMCTPNPWLPDASCNPNPATPNVMLACSYKELQTAAALAERGPVKLSYSGRLISWDMSRKWSIWQIPSPYSDFVRRPDGTDQFFIGNGRRNSKVYELDPQALNDDGIAINSLYTTYGLVRAEQAERFGPILGLYRKLFRYSSYRVEGAGLLRLRALINDLNAKVPYVVPGGIKLTCPCDSNREVPFNLEGQRLYLEFSTNCPTANFRLNQIIVSAVKSPFAVVRGVN